MEQVFIRIRDAVRRRTGRWAWFLVSLVVAGAAWLVLRVANAVLDNVLVDRVWNPFVAWFVRFIGEPIGVIGLLLGLAGLFTICALVGLAVFDNLSWVVRRRERREGKRRLTVEERAIVNALRERWSVHAHNAVVAVHNGLNNFTNSDNSPVGALFRYPQHRLHLSHESLKAIVDGDEPRMPPAEVKAVLARFLVDYMDAVRWLHIGCEVFDPQIMTEPWYSPSIAKWTDNHQRLIDDLTALARNIYWGELMAAMERAGCWSPRFPKLESGKFHVPDRVR
jgi:hypothetical protein